MKKLTGHKQEVCGLKWNTEENLLASGGNDNRLLVWDRMSETPSMRFNEHTAAVKAIAWSPHQVLVAVFFFGISVLLYSEEFWRPVEEPQIEG